LGTCAGYRGYGILWRLPLAATVSLSTLAAVKWLQSLIILSTIRVFGATTVSGLTLTVVLGRYFERKKEIEAHYRQKKTEMYDSFLKEFFKSIHKPKDENLNLIPFLREWQRA
jgi:hypothetical protein